MKKLPRIVLMIEPLGEYVQGLLRGIVKYSNTKGPWTFYKEPGKHEGILPQLDPEQADGIFARIPNTSKARKKLPQNVPVIIIGYREMISGLSQILGDCKAIAEIAAKYFIGKGFRNFAFCGFDEMHWSRERAQCFRHIIKEYGHDVFFYKNLNIAKRKSWQVEQQDIAKWLKKLPKPIAILACNDDRGQHLVNGCKLAKIRIPDEVSILGVDNDKFVCGLTYPPLSSIALGTERAGFEAAELMAKMMKNNSFANEVIMVRPTHVVTRHSTDAMAIQDPAISDAINFIQKNIDSDICVDDVVNAAAVSRRNLERRFRKQLNKSIHEEIKHARVNRITVMLLETDLTITQIGLALGFRDLTHIGRFFKEETGLSPLAYRRKFINKPG